MKIQKFISIVICIVIINIISCKNNSFESLLKSAENGDAEAQYRVALHYYNGDKVKKDYNNPSSI